MKSCTRFISALSDAQCFFLNTLLEHVYSQVSVQRQRAQAVHSSAKGLTLEQLLAPCKMHPETVSG